MGVKLFVGGDDTMTDYDRTRMIRFLDTLSRNLEIEEDVLENAISRTMREQNVKSITISSYSCNLELTKFKSINGQVTLGV